MSSPEAAVSEHLLPNRLPLYATAAMLTVVGTFGASPNVASAQAEAGDPVDLANRAASLVATTAKAWQAHQLPDGNLMDPTGRSVGSYGLPMIGQAMVKTGVATGDEGLLNSGIRAITREIGNPTGGGFETFGLADAIIDNEILLAGNPNWQAAKGPIVNLLQNRTSLTVGEGAQKCHDNSLCWNNLKAVGAFALSKIAAVLKMGQTPVSPETPTAFLTPEIGDSLQMAANHTNSDARRVGGGMDFGEAGVVSDPSTYPLAYHAMCAMILGRAMQEVGPGNTPAPVREAFFRSARAIIGLMAPDGDVAYMGRGQGQVWVPAATADALAIAARNTADPSWRGRYLAGVNRSIGRLETLYTPGSHGMPLVPRLRGVSTTDYQGIDGYASSVTYNGLALDVLADAVDQLRQTSLAPIGQIGADVKGAFIDPSHAKLASVRRGNLWFAVHGSATHRKDARYDFGLIAAQRRVNGVWQSVLPPRPLTQSMASGGPVLINKRGKKLVPSGETITANGQGVVKVRGGWTAGHGSTHVVNPNTRWTFHPRTDGVEMDFLAKPGTYKFQVWYPDGSRVVKTKWGIHVTEPSGKQTSYALNTPVQVSSPNISYHSAYDRVLDSSILSLRTHKAAKNIVYRTMFK